MQVRHDTSLLEAAVSQIVRKGELPILAAEAEAEQRKARSQANLRLATGVAIAIVAVGIGLGVMLLRYSPLDPFAAPFDQSGQDVPAPPDEEASPPLTPIPGPSVSGSEDKEDVTPTPATELGPEPIVTTDFSKFSEIKRTLGGVTWTIMAGHAFDSENDPSWRRAWCYVNHDVNGVSLDIQLAYRSSPGSAPTAPVATIQTLTQAGLTRKEALDLAALCPWLNGERFTVDELNQRPAPKDVAEPSISEAIPSEPPISEPSVSLIGRVLRYEGEIDERFQALLQGYDFDELSITSNGGLISAALEGGRWLRLGGKSVEATGDCLSACVFVLASGVTRGAGETARIGVHRFYGDGTGDVATAIESAQQTSSEIIGYLTQMGVDTALFHAMAATPSESIAYLDEERLRRWRLLNDDAAVVQTSEWFDALPSLERTRLQTDLLLLGHYTSLVDGVFGSGTVQAIKAYQAERGVSPNGYLDAVARRDMHDRAQQVFSDFGFQLHLDETAQAAMALPMALLTYQEPRATGTYLASPAGLIDVTLTRHPVGSDFDQLFVSELWETSQREVTYSSKSSSRFVVAGRIGNRSFYKFFSNEGRDGIVGFVVSWGAAQAGEGNVVAMFLASNFMSLNRYDGGGLQVERMTATLDDY